MPLRPELDRPSEAGAPHPRPLFRRHAGITLVLAMYLALGVLYSLVTPLFEASDELWHYPFVKHLADGNGLPVQYPHLLGPWRQQGSQPPLYYALGAALTFWIDTDDMHLVRRLNPHVDMGVITADRNVNMAIHGPAERWPYRGTALAVRVVRWASVVMGAVTVLAGYLLARTVWPGHRALAVGAAALTASNAMFLFITASVNNDALVMALSAVALWRIAAAVARPPTRAQWAFLGLILGLNAITKVSGLVMLPLAGLTVALAAALGTTALGTTALGGTPRQRSWRDFLTAGVVVGLPVLLVAGWWYWRNWRLYGDPLGLNAFVAIVGPRYPVPSLRQLAAEWQGFLMAYWGFFGGVNVPAPEWAYSLLNAVGGIGLAAAPLYVWQEWRRRALHLTHGLQMGLIAVWPVAVFVALIRWTLMTVASQGRLMFPALTALSLLMAMGLSALLRWRPVPRFWQRAPLALAALIMLVVAALLPWTTIRPAYAHPPLLGEEELAALEDQGITTASATFGERVQLLGYRIEPDAVAPGDSVTVTVYWRCLGPIEQDWSVFVHLVGADEIIIGQRDMYPGQGNYPTSLWAPGDAFADSYVVPVSPTTLTPNEAEVVIGWYRLETGERLVLDSAAGGAPADSLRLGRVSLPARVVDGIPNPTFLNLGDKVALIGYALDRTAAAPGETFGLTLYWEALADLDTNYSVFTQVLGDEHRLWAQADGWPLGGAAPTATWRRGQRVVDPYELTVARDAPPGVYELQVGMYDASGARLSLLGRGGHVQDTRILLGRVRVVAAP